MLNYFLHDYLNYCNMLGLAKNSNKELARYIKQLNTFLIKDGLSAIGQLQYKHLFNFVISGNAAPTSIKARIWALKKFFCYLHLTGHIKDNPALALSPPKIPKKETTFLSEGELKIIFKALIKNSHTTNGLRDILIIALMAITGLRKSSVVNLDIEDFDAASHSLTVREKGLAGKRPISVPSAVSMLLNEYIHHLDIKAGPLFLNRKKQRSAPDSVNKITGRLKELLLEDCHPFAEMLHPHIFRHSAGTQLNEVAGFTLTKELPGHRNGQNTRKYIHLSPTSYGAYMVRHPFFNHKTKAVLP